MKTKSLFLFATLAVFAMAGMASADTDTQLGGVMKDMASNIQQITAQSTDATKNADSAHLCDLITADIATARTLTPEKIGALPSDQQPAQLAQFQAMLDKLTSEISQMKADFVANNNAAVTNDLNVINQTKIAGHKAFKQD